MAIQTEEMGREKKEYRRRLYDQIVKEKNTHLTQREKQKAAKKVKKEKTKKTERLMSFLKIILIIFFNKKIYIYFITLLVYDKLEIKMLALQQT